MTAGFSTLFLAERRSIVPQPKKAAALEAVDALVLLSSISLYLSLKPLTLLEIDLGPGNMEFS
jgi:hypothetical protein